jgi:predicted aldo/keto reductase-like oxidoreductase
MAKLTINQQRLLDYINQHEPDKKIIYLNRQQITEGVIFRTRKKDVEVIEDTPERQVTQTTIEWQEGKPCPNTINLALNRLHMLNYIKLTRVGIKSQSVNKIIKQNYGTTTR